MPPKGYYVAKHLKRKQARASHQLQKRRARYKRILDQYEPADVWIYPSTMTYASTIRSNDFNAMIVELCALNLKYLQTLLCDLNKNDFIGLWNKECCRKMKDAIEASILERTILK
jgi:hypothetical protein